MKEKILLLEDDAFLRDGLYEMLEKEGYIVTCATTIKSAKEIVLADNFNLIIFDVMLPDGNGFDLCRDVRSSGISTPILFLTACDDEIQIVRGLDSGADDYVTKPFKLLELMSRIRALIRRSSSNISVYKNSDIVIDTNNFTVKRNEKNVFVTKTEFQILSCLMRNNGVIVSRSVLLQNIWDDNNNFIDDNTLSVHVSRLREKIGAKHIVTIRGVGYRWEE
ncbi:MAG: response regulator transcription factor [Acetobacter sp.]|nr:response regulator transcription factor [Bacteroides sp.]MCM1341547.1 response regulator transcription factor [Acetobacter sp.]MCM1433624.1 response regulator transcription factor [Clostridiales bacterium]